MTDTPNEPQATAEQTLPGTAQPAPGKLHGEVWLTVQTLMAQGLILGRAATAGKPAIPGLLDFAVRLRVIWSAAGADDPYADWWLIKIDEALEQARLCIRSEQAALDAIIAMQSALKIQVGVSEQPYRITLKFANPYAFSAAQLIGEFDDIARSVLTAKYVGLLNSTAAHRSLQACSGPMRTLFAAPQGYRRLSLDREAMKGDTKVAQEAVLAMGELPPAVFSGERRASLSPYRSGRAASPTERQATDRS